MIKITDTYYADTDNYNWILCKKHIVTEAEANKSKSKTAGDIEYKNLSYHATLQQLLEKLFGKHKRAIAKDCNLKEYIEELKAMQEDFINKVKENLRNE